MASKYEIVARMNHESLEQLCKGEITQVDLSADMRLLTDRKTGGGRYFIDEEGRVSGCINADGIGILKYIHREFGYTGTVSLLRNVLTLGGASKSKSVTINLEAATLEQIAKLKELGILK